MGIFGESQIERVTREAYVLLWNASERFKQGRALYDNLEAIEKRAAWIERNELERTADSLIKYGASLAQVATALLGQLSEFKGRPFLNVAIQPDKEKAILDLFYKATADQIRHDVRDFDKRDDELPSIGHILHKIVSERG